MDNNVVFHGTKDGHETNTNIALYLFENQELIYKIELLLKLNLHRYSSCTNYFWLFPNRFTKGNGMKAVT